MNHYARIRPVTGGSTSSGRAYHTIPGVDGPAHRTDTQDRVDHIVAHFDPNGLTGSDVGCSVGGISIGLAAHGARMRGYDWDREAIGVARRVRNDRRLDCTFAVADLTTEQPWTEIVAADFVVWMSNWMWIAKLAGAEFARSRLELVAENVDTLIFETAEGDVSMAGSGGLATAADVEQMLAETTGYDVTNLGPPPGDRWHRRSVFLCVKD